MAGFRKAEAKQAALKVSMYGPPGSGKTLTALLLAEGLAGNKRIAFVDTEHGTDFYAKAVPARQCHPKAFDFDALYTRSLTEALNECKKLKVEDYAVVVIDSITHLWEAAKASYTGQMTKVGSLPMHAWARIKKPYKELMQWAINSPFHVFLLGRQGNEFVEDEETGEVKANGVKMKAEGETQYEPHICIRMEPFKDKKAKTQVITAFIEKDRSGILSGQTIVWPTFEKIAQPLLGLLGSEQAQLQGEDDAAQQDAEVLARQDREKAQRSKELLKEFSAKFDLAKSKEEAVALGKTITPEIKRQMLTADVEALKTKWDEVVTQLKSVPTPEPSHAQEGTNGVRKPLKEQVKEAAHAAAREPGSEG